MQGVIKRELIDTLQYMKIPHNRKFVDSSTNTLQKALDYKMKYYKNKDIKSYEVLKHIEKETKKEV